MAQIRARVHIITKHVKIKDALSILLLCAIIIGFFAHIFWPQLKILVTPDFGRSDAWHFSYPTKFLLGKALHESTLPLWEPTLGGGFPLLAEGQTGTFYIPNLILFTIFPPIIAYNNALVLSVLLFATGMYVFVRTLGISAFPSLFAGALAGFSGIIIPQLPHITLLQGLSLAPWILAVTWRYIRFPKLTSGLIWSAIISQQLMSGFPQAVFVTLLSASFFILWHKNRIPLFFQFMMFGTIALGLSAVQLFPSWEFLRQSTDPAGFSPDVASYFSYPLSHIRTLIDPYLLGNPKTGTYPPFYAFDGSIFWENTAYIGIVPLLLLPFAYCGKKGKRTKAIVLLFTLIILLSFLFALGKYSPIYVIYSIWPFTLFRVPSRFLWVMVMSLLVLAAYGLEHVISTYRRRMVLLCITGFVCAAQVAYVGVMWNTYHAFEPTIHWVTPPNTLSNLPPDATVYVLGVGRSYQTPFVTNGWADMTPYRQLVGSLEANTNALWNIRNHTVYAGRFLRRQTLYDQLLLQELHVSQNAATPSATGLSLLSMASIDHLISTIPINDAHFVPVTNGNYPDNPFMLYRYTRALPQARLVYQTEHAQTTQEFQHIISSPTFHPATTVTVEDDTSLLLRSPVVETATITQISSTRVSQTYEIINNPQIGILVTSDTYYPGWEASINSHSALVFPVNIRYRGVLVPPGTHTVTFSYHPKGFSLGLTVTVTTGVLYLILMVRAVFFANARTPSGTHGYFLRHAGNRDTQKAHGR